MKKVLLVELFAYHHECLYPQIRFLKDAGVDLTLVANQKLKKAIDALELDFEVTYFDFNKLSSFFALRSFIIKNKFEIVILNTIQGSAALKFSLLPLPKWVKVVGTLHDTSKLETSVGQRMISKKYNRFYTLSKYIQTPPMEKMRLETTCFNPCYFKEYQLVNLNKGSEIWISIPGSVSWSRRDYDFLVEIAQHNDLNKNVKFIILGNINSQDGIILSEKIKELGIADHFILFDHFVADELFHSYLKSSDYLLPLIHPDTPSAKQYLTNKISGVYPLSLGYQKTMICHEMFSTVNNFDYPSVYYHDLDACVELINKQEQAKTKISPNYQEDKERYLSFIGLQ